MGENLAPASKRLQGSGSAEEACAQASRTSRGWPYLPLEAMTDRAHRAALTVLLSPAIVACMGGGHGSPNSLHLCWSEILSSESRSTRQGAEPPGDLVNKALL